jgi:hypothetical protein
VIGKYVFAALAIVYLVLGTKRAREGGASRAQARTWLLVGAIFGLVSVWLFARG